MDETLKPNNVFIIEPTPVYDISFGGENGELGRLTFDNDQIHFTGKADESAKSFFEHFLKPMVDNYIAEKLKNVEKAKQLCRKHSGASEFYDKLIQGDWVQMSPLAKNFVNQISQQILDALEGK